MYTNENPSPSDFTGLTSVQVRTYRVVQLAKNVFVAFFSFQFASVTTPIQDVRVKLPEGIVTEAIEAGTFKYLDNGVDGVGQVYTLDGGTELLFRKGPGNPWSVANANTFLEGQIVFETREQ